MAFLKHRKGILKANDLPGWQEREDPNTAESKKKSEERTSFISDKLENVYVVSRALQTFLSFDGKVTKG